MRTIFSTISRPRLIKIFINQKDNFGTQIRFFSVTTFTITVLSRPEIYFKYKNRDCLQLTLVVIFVDT